MKFKLIVQSYIQLLTNKKTKIVFTDSEWRFNSEWLLDTELEYELPTGEKKFFKIK